MIFLLFIFGFVAAGLAIWLAALTSPSGYQDETGFHYGTQPKPVRQNRQKTRRKTVTPLRAQPEVVASQKKTERKSISHPKKPVEEWETPEPASDQLKFPFPAVH